MPSYILTSLRDTTAARVLIDDNAPPPLRSVSRSPTPWRTPKDAIERNPHALNGAMTMESLSMNNAICTQYEAFSDDDGLTLMDRMAKAQAARYETFSAVINGRLSVGGLCPGSIAGIAHTNLALRNSTVIVSEQTGKAVRFTSRKELSPRAFRQRFAA